MWHLSAFLHGKKCIFQLIFGISLAKIQHFQIICPIFFSDRLMTTSWRRGSLDLAVCYIKYHKHYYINYLIQYLLLYKVIDFFAVLFGVLFGGGCLL